MIRVCIVAEHHHALAAWAAYRNTLPAPPRLLTLDHHTDTLPAFQRAAAGDESLRHRLIDACDRRRAESVRQAIAALRHDEHIDLALRTGVVRQPVIVSHAPPPTSSPDITVAADPGWPELNRLLNAPQEFRPLADRVLESDWLDARLRSAGFDPEPGYIFDLDLDYLLTEQALHPADDATLCRLLTIAGLITVSLENDWVNLLKLDRCIDSHLLLDAFLIRLRMYRLDFEIIVNIS